LVGWLFVCLVGCLFVWLVVCLFGWLVVCLFGWSVVYISDFDDASSHPKTYHRPVTAHRGENWMLQDILPDATISGNLR